MHSENTKLPGGNSWQKTVTRKYKIVPLTLIVLTSESRHLGVQNGLCRNEMGDKRYQNDN